MARVAILRNEVPDAEMAGRFEREIADALAHASPPDMPFTCAMLDYFVEIGGNCIDTAVVYGGGRSERALRHGVGVEKGTSVPAEAYAPFPKWQPGRPKSGAGLPWS